MRHEFCIVLTTTNSNEIKQKIVNQLLSERLAACVQTMPIDSHYVWQGEVCNDQEILMIIKTKKSHFSEVSRVIEQIHDYDVPQIVQVPIADGSNSYLSWIANSTI